MLFPMSELSPFSPFLFLLLADSFPILSGDKNTEGKINVIVNYDMKMIKVTATSTHRSNLADQLWH